ncbi:hypothetical protein [Acinetobacter gyllenbergii]|uniref:hypothetical protein n=1 Tax=Acinetobacter gyllenbergii TaxID=134534 RepID=UPI0008068C38|nr:hypothetical protein [Acinetobacter gyllenbergii]OBY72580.1 hypothetical protein NG55_19060 [Acinetobacter gyllenbergii]
MAKKKILTIGFFLYGDDSEYCEYSSENSLLDWDIILIKPDISDYSFRGNDYFKGKKSLSDHDSFILKSKTEHWKREIKTAVDHGKLVILFLNTLQEVYIATGDKQYSGTGKNRQVTRIVDIYSNYDILPIKLKITNTKGKEIKLAPKKSEVISTYWASLGEISSYQVFVEGSVTPCLQTKHGDKTVGFILNSNNSNGTLIGLPDIDFSNESFFDEDLDDWSIEGQQFSHNFIKQIVSLEKSLKQGSELTVEPDWAKKDEFKLEVEISATKKLLVLEENINTLNNKKQLILDEIGELNKLRNLLFEKGKPLEFAILDALRTLGFSVAQYEDADSEFDAVFESNEGRLIGEVEGKDTKAINIDKLRQLALNIHEDLQREEVLEPAKSVLFGNAYRLLPLTERENPFTDKCISAAMISSTALVFTPDLFLVAKYLKDNKNARFATQCRKSILEAVGRVKFPSIPTKNGNTL